MILRHDARDLRLLQHHLGDEDAVGIARPAPRQVARRAAIPCAQPATELAERERIDCCCYINNYFGVQIGFPVNRPLVKPIWCARYSPKAMLANPAA